VPKAYTRTGRVMVAAITALALSLPAIGVGAASAQRDPRQQRDEVRKQKAAAAAEVDALRADEAEVRQALADIQTNLAGQRAQLDDARFAEAQATEAARLARQRELAVQEQIVSIKDQLRVVAVRAYVDGGTGPQTFDSSGSTALDDVVRQSYLQLAANRHVSLSDQLRAAEEDLALARRDAEAAAALATHKRAEIEQRVGEVESAQRQQEAFVAEVEARLDQRLSEAANLSALDQKLANEIAEQEAAIAARLPRGGSGAASGPVGNIPLTTVRGITVASSIADQLERMLAAAEADGYVFGGNGYRDSSAQWQLRQQNCPDPANSPPSACSPPTARAGASMHERGLAVDFTYGGRIISSHDNAGFQWLANNAGRFGFSNLPSEPWHWSVNGQ